MRRAEIGDTKMRKFLALVSVIVLIALIAVATAGCTGSDEALVEDLIYRETEAWNNDDHEAMYEMMSPNYRETASYNAFKEFADTKHALKEMAFGTAKYEIDDVQIRIEDSWAFASYVVVIDGEEVIDLGGVDIYRKTNGKWYNVAEDSSLDPGYNEEDLPPDFGAK